MHSGISFFNRGISRNLLQRFWPLWAAYLCFLLLLLPGNLSSQAARVGDAVRQSVSLEEAVAGMDLSAVHEGITVVYVSALVGVAAAMAMYHYLYRSGSCGLMNSLPVRRETMFLTAWLTGLVPLLLSDLLAAALTALLFCTRGLLHVRALLQFLALAVMGNVAFYGFAVFCAMLTGSLLILPIVYAVLNFTAAAAEGCARELLSGFVFGMIGGSPRLHFLSPPVLLAERLSTARLQPYGFTLNGLGILAAYCAAGLVFSAAALLLYRRRRMETAGDVVAIRVLKPVFKYCLCFGTALVFADLLLVTLWRSWVRGLSGALLVLGAMLIGAFVGYFAAEMLIRKTLKVFRGRWRGFAAACAVIAVFVGVFEFDLTGYEKRVPAPEDVEYVSLWSAGEVADLKDPARIAEVTEFHRAVIADKALCEAEESDCGIAIHYELSDGRTLSRMYSLPAADSGDVGSLLRRAEALLNAPEAILARARADSPFTQERIVNADIDYGFPDRTGERDHLVWTGTDLTPEKAVSLYREGILPDAEAGQIALAHLVADGSYDENVYPVNINFALRAENGDHMVLFSFPVERCSANTLRWLRDNTDLELKTFAELGMNGK